MVRIARSPRLAIIALLGAAIFAVVACGGETIVEKVVVQTVIVEKQVPGEKVVETVIVKEQVAGEKVVETVIVEKIVAGEKVVETVIVETERIVREQVVETVIVEKVVEKTVVETVVVEVVAIPGAPRVQTGTLIVSVASVGTPLFINRDAVGPTNMMPVRWGFTETLAQWQNGSCLVPMLATSWVVNKDSTSVAFSIREGVNFVSKDRDWGEMTAEDIVWSVNDSGADNPDSVHSQAGEVAETWKPWSVKTKFKVDAPFNTFRGDFMRATDFSTCGDMVGIVSRKVFDELGENGARTEAAGTGPFVVQSWQPNEKIEAIAREDHWRKVPSFKNLVILEIPEASVRAAQLRTGETDLAPVSISDIPTLTKAGIQFNPGMNLFQGNFVYFGGNWWQDTIPETGEAIEPRKGFKPDDAHPWIGDPSDPARMESARKVRWAMAMAIDRELINETILAGLGGPIYGGHGGVQVHQDHPWWDDKWVIPFDPEKSKQYLAEAGYPNGFKVDDFWCPTDVGTNGEVCLAVAGMWLDIGIETSVTSAAYTSRRPGWVARENSFVWIAPWGVNRISARNDPGGAVFGGNLWASTTGGFAPCCEADEYYNFFQKAAAQEPGSPENRATWDAASDWAYENMLAAGVVEVPKVVAVNPNRVAFWELQPLAFFINHFESVILK